MFSAVRLAFYLGIRRLYLLGADFRMDHDRPYGFDQGKSSGGVRGNNDAYAGMCSMFDELRPHFDREGFDVLNCNPQSALWSFDFVTFDEAIEEATGTFEQLLDTEGWYRSDNEKEENR